MEEQFPVPRNTAASKIGNGVISLLWQLQCNCNPDHNKFSSLSNTTEVSIFPNLCLWRRSLRWNLRGIDLEKLYRATLTCYNMDVHRLYCTSCDISHPLTRGRTVVRTDIPTEGVILSEPKFLGCINIKTESVRKLSNFYFQCTKTLYQNYLKRIAFFFSFFKG